MAVQYGMRTKDAAAVVSLDTTITPIRSLKMLQVTGNGAFDQYISIPEIQAQSFVVVDTLEDRGEYTFSPQAWYSPGQLQLRQPQNLTWKVMVLSQGGEPFSAPGSYGIRTFNNNVRTQIDAVNRILNVHSSGNFQFGYFAPGNYLEWAGVNFPTVITTQERPLVFFNSADYMMVGNFHVRGSPGNWTGFRLKSYANPKFHGNSAFSPMSIKWFCASYQVPTTSTEEYDASVRDAVGNRTFVTSANLSLLNSQPAINAFVSAGNPITGIGGYYAPSQQMPWTGSYDDYVLANALFSCTNIIQTTQPIRANFGGFLPGNRSILQMYCDNGSGINPLTANGRTLFASRPMKPL